MLEIPCRTPALPEGSCPSLCAGALGPKSLQWHQKSFGKHCQFLGAQFVTIRPKKPLNTSGFWAPFKLSSTSEPSSWVWCAALESRLKQHQVLCSTSAKNSLDLPGWAALEIPAALHQSLQTTQGTGTLCHGQQKQPSGLRAALLHFLMMLHGFNLLLKQALSPARVWIISELRFFFSLTGCPAAPIKKPLIPQPFLTAKLKLLLNLSKSQATHI